MRLDPLMVVIGRSVIRTGGRGVQWDGAGAQSVWLKRWGLVVDNRGGVGCRLCGVCALRWSGCLRCWAMLISMGRARG